MGRPRLIPACAGKTGDCADVHGAARAHPRVCGENSAADSFVRLTTGSSPRVRGKLQQDPASAAKVRLIPACAGKTTCPLSCSPRPVGSSPRVRGKREGHLGLTHQSGLIPACAGKTRYRAHPGMVYRAHPRVCGENFWEVAMEHEKPGSSPRVRGKRSHFRMGIAATWLIPACAGKTPRRRGRTGSPSAHPRVCGENTS